jgi:hypothetical protein
MLSYCFLTLYPLCSPGKAVGDLYEDDGDGFGYKNGDYLLTHYEAEKVSSLSAKDGEVVIRIASVEGHRERPKRTLHVRLLIGQNVQVSENATSYFAEWFVATNFHN